MPKLKTRKAAAKRFKIKKSGKIMFERANHQHILETKSNKQKRKSRKKGSLNKADLPRLKRTLGI